MARTARRSARVLVATDAVLVDRSGLVMQVNRGVSAVDQPDRQDGTWVDAAAGSCCAGMARQADGSFAAPPVPPPPVPESVTNFQARAVMRQTIMPDGRSLFTTINDDLSGARLMLADKPDSDPAKIAAEIAWQAWEQANDYLRHGPLVTSLSSKFGFDDTRTDALFFAASQVIA